MSRIIRYALAFILVVLSSPAQASSGYKEITAALQQDISQLLAAYAFRSFFYQPFSMPSGSMNPTLMPGDYFFVSKPAYGYSRFSFPFAPEFLGDGARVRIPERGDVVVFKHPRKDRCSEGPLSALFRLLVNEIALFGSSRYEARPDDCVDYVKRVIGLPGDTVEFRDGELFLNGISIRSGKTTNYQDIKVPRGHQVCLNDPVPIGGICEIEQWIEKMPKGRSYTVLDLGRTRYDNFEPVTVNPGMIFVMGDNRDNSVDSRFPNLGQVPIENLVGKVKVIAFSSKTALWNIKDWRLDRLWKSVQ